MDLYADLTWRGLVNQCTAPEHVPQLARQRAAHALLRL